MNRLIITALLTALGSSLASAQPANNEARQAQRAQ